MKYDATLLGVGFLHLDWSEYGCGDITLTQGRARHANIFLTSTRGESYL